MRKKIQEKIQNVLSSFKKETPAPLKTVEEVTEASRKVDRLRAQAKGMERVAMGTYSIGALAMAGLTVAGVTVAAPAVGAVFLGWTAVMGAGFYQERKAFKLEDRILKAENEEGRYINRTYNDQEIAKFEADLVKKEKLEKKRDVLSKVYSGALIGTLAVMVGGVAIMTAGVGAAIIQPAFLTAWAIWGAGQYVGTHRDSLNNRISGARSYEWGRKFDAKMDALAQEIKATAGLAAAPAAGKDFDAAADKTAPAADQSAKTPAAKPAPAPKGPSA